MNIDLSKYELHQPNNIKIVNKELKTIDIEVKDDNTFYLVGKNDDLILTHNCDGSHIKGLIINFFHLFWPELLNLDFIYEFVTPIIKIEKGTEKNKQAKFFYKLDDYRKWKELNEKGWFVTYYKGLGTIEPDEAIAFFKNITKHLIRFHQTEMEETTNAIDLAFNEKRADDRKEWLLNYKTGIEVDKFAKKTTYMSFFNEEFIQFSMADNIRSIPSIMDGLKPSQRKILYTLFKNNYKEKIKVSNLSGAVTEKSSYHHGAASLEQGIIGMAQNFVGSNNINLLDPLGNYGSRVKGGSDAASSRYIFTKLTPVARALFPDVDDNILNYLDDDGFSIEPLFYTPIIPMCLVNGIEGIGTGWSTFIPCFNPKDIVKYLGNKIQNKTNDVTLAPYYKGFTGKIIFDESKNRYVTQGIIKKVNMSTLRITELPIGMWNNKYYDILDELIEQKIIKDYTKNDTNVLVDITVNIARETLTKMEEEANFHKVFKLESYLSMGNLMLWDTTGKIKRYDTISEIIDEFYEERLKYYQLRKDYMINKLEYERKVFLNKMKFINAILKGNIKINNVKRTDLEINMEEQGIERIEDSYNYLVNMSLLSLTNEKLLELKTSYDKKKEEIQTIIDITLAQMWISDLKILVPFIK